MKPVYKSTAEPEWKPIPREMEYIEDDDGYLNVSFRFDFSGNVK